MTAGELQYLLQRLLNIVNLNEALTLAAIAMIAKGLIPALLPEARAALWLWLRNYAHRQTLSSFLWVPAGLALLYVIK